MLTSVLSPAEGYQKNEKEKDGRKQNNKRRFEALNLHLSKMWICPWNPHNRATTQATHRYYKIPWTHRDLNPDESIFYWLLQKREILEQDPRSIILLQGRTSPLQVSPIPSLNTKHLPSGSGNYVSLKLSLLKKWCRSALKQMPKCPTLFFPGISGKQNTKALSFTEEIWHCY